MSVISLEAVASPATTDLAALAEILQPAELVSVTVRLADGREQEVPLGQGWAWLRFPDGELGVVSPRMAARFGLELNWARAAERDEAAGA